jgi:class 3 adenylate cyclase
MGAAGGLPEGTVTFLFTDLEGSPRRLQAHPAAYRDAVTRHHALLREAAERHGGAVFETVGDAVYAAFARPTDAVAAALAGQVALCQEAWGAPGPLRARMGLHSGEAEFREAELALGQVCLARYGTLRPGGPSPVLHTYPDAEGRVDLRWLRLRDAT